MGTEVNANVNYNIMKGLDVGVYAAYAWLGDYFKSGTPPASKVPRTPTTTYARMNYALLSDDGTVRFTEGPRGKPRGLFLLTD